MNPTNPTEQAHNNLKNLLLNGRILINGLPLTANELSMTLQGEQMLFEKASKLDVEQQGAKANPEKMPEKKEK